jgi:hypothetical protein
VEACGSAAGTKVPPAGIPGARFGVPAAMEEAVQTSPDPAGPLNPVPAQRARLLLAQGDVDGAARWTKENGLGAEDEPCYTSEPEHLVLARVLLAQGRPGQALALPDRRHAAAVTQDRTGSVIEAGALDTVKKHVSHVLSKLGAANRTEAVSPARRLDLIP